MTDDEPNPDRQTPGKTSTQADEQAEKSEFESSGQNMADDEPEDLSESTDTSSTRWAGLSTFVSVALVGGYLAAVFLDALGMVAFDLSSVGAYTLAALTLAFVAAVVYALGQSTLKVAREVLGGGGK